MEQFWHIPEVGNEAGMLLLGLDPKIPKFTPKTPVEPAPGQPKNGEKKAFPGDFFSSQNMEKSHSKAGKKRLFHVILFLPKHGKIPLKPREKWLLQVIFPAGSCWASWAVDKTCPKPGKNGFSASFSFWELLSCMEKIPLQIKEKRLFHLIFPPKTWERPTPKEGKHLFQRVFPLAAARPPKTWKIPAPNQEKKAFPAYFSSWEHPSHWMHGKILFKTRENEFSTLFFLQNYGKILLKMKENGFFQVIFPAWTPKAWIKKCSKTGKNSFSR